MWSQQYRTPEYWFQHFRLSIFLSITCLRKNKPFYLQNVSIIIANQSILLQRLNVDPITINATMVKVCFSTNKWVTGCLRPARQFQLGDLPSSLALFYVLLARHLSAGWPDRPVTNFRSGCFAFFSIIVMLFVLQWFAMFNFRLCCTFSLSFCGWVSHPALFSCIVLNVWFSSSWMILLILQFRFYCMICKVIYI